MTLILVTFLTSFSAALCRFRISADDLRIGSGRYAKNYINRTDRIGTIHMWRYFNVNLLIVYIHFISLLNHFIFVCNNVFVNTYRKGSMTG